MRERSVAQSHASVMIYNNDLKKWEHAGGSQGISRVHVYFNPNNDSYRIVGRKVNDNEVVINCIIAKSLNYNKATATFHQWRDQRQVYGLNFQMPDDAVCFSEAVLGAVEALAKSPPSQDSTPHNGNDGHTAYRQQQEPYRPPQQTEALKISQPPVQASPPKVQSSVPQPPPALPIVTNVPPSTPAPPPTPPIGGGPPPPPPPPPIGGSGPPAPPPPPTLGSSGGGSGGSSSFAGDVGLASALASVQLKKRSESTEDRRPPPAAASQMGNMMDALNKKLLARKKVVENPDGAVENEKPAHVVNKTPAPPPMIKAPTSTLVTKTPVPAFNKNLGAKKTTNDTICGNSTANAGASLSADELKSLKGEIMSCVKEEIQAAKNEILQVLRQELSKLSSS